MDEIESQIAKIALGNNKSSSTYVYTMAEKAPVGETELYVVAELPLFNPAAEESCQRICLAIGSTLKRAYKRTPLPNHFETAIGQVNEELGKLASMGQTNWIYKLNCILAVKDGATFHIATCGKVSAFLLRSGQYTDISCSPQESHPLKTFENLASGKIRLGDLLILSTTQLFNHLSMDRLLNIVENSPFLTATQTIIQILKDTADNQVSFGVLLNLQVPAGQVVEEEVDVENYTVENTNQNNWLSWTVNYFKSTFALGKNTTRQPKTDLPQISMADKLKNFSQTTKNWQANSKNIWENVKIYAIAAKNNLSISKFKSLDKTKQFFYVSLVVLMLAVVVSIYAAIKVSGNKKTLAEISGQLNKAQELLDSSQSSLLYKDYNSAGQFILDAKKLLPAENLVPSSNLDQYKKLTEQVNTLEQQMQRQVTPEVETLGNLGSGEKLISTPKVLALQTNNAIISYNLETGKIQDGQLQSSVNINSNIFINNNSVVIYDGSALYVWDTANSKLSAGFLNNVPNKDDFAGMSYYPTNNKVYLLNKNASQITSFAFSVNGLSKPTISLTDPTLSGAQDLTIDSAIYVLTKSGVVKFVAGKLAEFNFPKLPTPFSGSGRIYTQTNFKYLYILDKDNNRVIVTDKVGNLIYTLKSDKFTKLTDFYVNESGKVIYLLNDGSLLKATLP
jgi:hypothetical protein